MERVGRITVPPSAPYTRLQRDVQNVLDCLPVLPTKGEAIAHARAKLFLGNLKGSSYTERGYDQVAGEYRYTLTIVLATGEAAIRD